MALQSTLKTYSEYGNAYGETKYSTVDCGFFPGIADICQASDV